MGDSVYDKKNTRQLSVKLNKKTDKDIIQHLDKLSNIQGYIKSLIRDDLARKLSPEILEEPTDPD